MLGYVASLLLAQASAAPGVVYLDCSISSDGGEPVAWKLMINESAGTVDYDNVISGPQRRPARFTADAVHFIDLTLSRVDLSIKGVTSFGSQLIHREGTCKLADTAERAF